MFDIKQKKNISLTSLCGNTQKSCSECMAWDKGGVINSPALSSGCTMNLLPDKHISCLESPSHTNKHGYLSKNWEVNEKCWEKKLQGLVAGLWIFLFLFPLLTMCIFSKSVLLSLSVFFTVLLPHLWPMKSWFFSVCLVQQPTLSQARERCAGPSEMCACQGCLTWHLLQCWQPALRVGTCRCDDKTLTPTHSHFPWAWRPSNS